MKYNMNNLITEDTRWVLKSPLLDILATLAF